MLARFWTHAPNGATVLEDLQALAAAGNVDNFKYAMRKWDAVRSMEWATVDIHETCTLEARDDVPDVKAVVLHRVLTAAAEAGQVDIAKYLMEQRGCVVYPTAVRAALKHNQWGVLELFLKKGWNINEAVGGNNTFPILKCVPSLTML
jgi:hypothetical protein